MKRQIVLFMAGLILFAAALPAASAPPQMVNYQGILTDQSGNPLTGNHDLSFKIYRDSVAVTPVIWSETQQDVPVNNGLFSVLLGRAVPLPLSVFSTSQERWLGVRVDTDAEMAPRMRFTSVPWALHSAVADSALTGPAVSDADWIIAGTNQYSGVSGNVGIGTSAPARKLHVDGGNAENGIRVAWGSAYPSVYGEIRRTLGTGLVINSNAGGGWADINFQTDGVTRAYLTSAGNFGIGTTTPTAMLEVAGTAKVQVLQITGADLAEKFPVSEPAEPGLVVAIDPDRPGQMCLARGEYNRRVAGVISGAGDLPAGAILGNLPGHEASLPMALSGRVWVRCDASGGAIAPGDLLTTSDVAGYAMKASDPARAAGATLGKAMTALADGRGLVLTLVSLQ